MLIELRSLVPSDLVGAVPFPPVHVLLVPPSVDDFEQPLLDPQLFFLLPFLLVQLVLTPHLPLSVFLDQYFLD